MVLDEGEQAREEVGAAEEGAREGRGAAEGEVVAAAAAGHAAVDEVLLGVQARVERGVEDGLEERDVAARVSEVGGMLTSRTPGIRRDREAAERRARAGAGSPRGSTSRARSRRTASTAATRSKKSAAEASGGRKTWTAPSRASTQRAVRTGARGRGRGGETRERIARWSGSPRRGARRGSGGSTGSSTTAEGLAGAERAEGQAEADGAVAGEEEEVAAAEGPALAGPARRRRARAGRTKPTSRPRPLAEHAREAAAILRVVEVGVERVDAGGEVRLVLEEAPRVLEGVEEEGLEAEARGEGRGDAAGVGRTEAPRRLGVERDVAPERPRRRRARTRSSAQRGRLSPG